MWAAASCDGPGAVGRADGVGHEERTAPSKPAPPSDEALSEGACRVLRAMGARGGWWLDRLIEATGLGVMPVNGALLELALAGQVEEGPLGFYSPVSGALMTGDQCGAR